MENKTAQTYQGEISGYRSETKTDSEGDFVHHYYFSLEGKDFHVQQYETLNLNNKDQVVLACTGEGKVLWLYNASRQSKYGKVPAHQTSSPVLRSAVTTGVITEKRLQSERVYRSAANYGPKYELCYSIILDGDKEFLTGKTHGEAFTPGDKIAVLHGRGKKEITAFYNYTQNTNSALNSPEHMGLRIVLLILLSSAFGYSFTFENKSLRLTGLFVSGTGLLIVILALLDSRKISRWQKMKLAELMEQVKDRA